MKQSVHTRQMRDGRKSILFKLLRRASQKHRPRVLEDASGGSAVVSLAKYEESRNFAIYKSQHDTRFETQLLDTYDLTHGAIP
jgi:hypothetical protein